MRSLDLSQVVTCVELTAFSAERYYLRMFFEPIAIDTLDVFSWSFRQLISNLGRRCLWSLVR